METKTLSNNTATAQLPDWRTLTLREQVAQTVVLHVTQDILPHGSIPDFFAKYPVGAIFAGGEVIEDGSNRFERVREIVAECQASSALPLLVSADLENGCGDVIPGLTPLPWPMALGASEDPDLAGRYGEASAREGRLAGINWALAPMADLNLHPLSSNVGTRAFGDEASRVCPLLRAFVARMQAAGMAACAKTFPGDGSDYRDQHLTTTANQLSREDWLASYGRVFQELINDGVATIMTAHITAPAFQSDAEIENGRYIPCTISKELTTGLLKEKMGFTGAIVSDAFGMGGILSHRDRERAAVDAFIAGVDLLLWPGVGFIDTVVAEIEAGRIPMARLEDALERIWRLKARFALLADASLPEASTIAAAEAVGRETAEASLTLLWNNEQTLPLNPDKDRRILLIGATPFDKAYERFEILQDELQGRGFEVTRRRRVTPEELEVLEPQYDRILVALERQFHRPLGPMDLAGEDARNFWSLSSHGWQKLVAVGFGSPYLVPWYFPQAQAAINAYASVPVVQRATAAALCGELPFPGKSPVLFRDRFGVKNLKDWASPN